MLIAIDNRPCSLSLRDKSMFNYEMTSKQTALKKVFIQKSIFVDIFFYFNPNRVMGINAICRVCLMVSTHENKKLREDDKSNKYLFVLFLTRGKRSVIEYLT